MVSTYPLATLCLGRLRRIGRLRIPTVNFITDFSVHPLWVHKGIDLNLAVHHAPAEMAARRTGRPSLACGPMVADTFDPALTAEPTVRASLRAGIGLGPADVGVLIVAGSWGIGHVERTFDVVASSGRYVPVVVCGRDEVLRARLLQRVEDGARGVAIGWTDQMPTLMGACDALIENAGGLTSLEALRMGLPVVSYEPIAGHGRENTAMMATHGVSTAASDARDLLRSLDLATVPGPARDAQVSAGAAIFRGDAAGLVAGAGRPESVARLASPRRARLVWATASRTAVGLAAVAAIGWTGITTGVDTAAATGAGVAAAAPGARAGYVGVRLGRAELADPAVVAALRTMHVSAVVDQETASLGATAVVRLVTAGVDVESGGHGTLEQDGHQANLALWTRAASDAAAGRSLASLTGHDVRFLVPGRRINAFDMIDAARNHETIVLPSIEVSAGVPSATQVPDVSAGDVVLVNGMAATPAQLLGALHRVVAKLRSGDLAVRPLSALR